MVVVSLVSIIGEDNFEQEDEQMIILLSYSIIIIIVLVIMCELVGAAVELLVSL